MNMKRHDIVNLVGQNFFTSNTEKDEFSYVQVLKRPFTNDEKHKFLDLRFEKEHVSVLIETKTKKFTNDDIEQLKSYMKLEAEYKKENHIIGILYNLKNAQTLIYKNSELLNEEKKLNSIDYYIDLFNERTNDKNTVIETTNSLNVDLHKYEIPERIRSQFIGSSLVALNNGLDYTHGLTTDEILERIIKILNSKIEDNKEKEIKTQLLISILNETVIRKMKSNDLISLLEKLRSKLIPYIDNHTSQGDDLLNLFFTTFNKYVGKADKNQAFTPTHITDFMCEITNVNCRSRVLDPTCGSGSFLVQAMSKMISNASNDESLINNIKQNQIYGIEYEEKAFGLATTNMLIHEDGKTNIILDSCFNRKDWIKSKNIDVVLMNPPFNGQNMPFDCPVNDKNNVDSTKGLYFVNFIADAVNKGKLATILPLQCAIAKKGPILEFKRKMLENHTLNAVFSLNDEVFHPGASVNACIMLFDLGRPHDSNKKTFFGFYKDDGFVKKKNKGRVEKRSWVNTKKKWLDLFEYRNEESGYSVLKSVKADDEWLAEAYMETDYSVLNDEMFIQTIRDFMSFKVKNGEINE